MKPKRWLGGVLGALVAGIAFAPAEAAPMNGATGNAGAIANDGVALGYVTWERDRYPRRYRYHYSNGRYYYGPRFHRERPRNLFQRWHWRDRYKHGG